MLIALDLEGPLVLGKDNGSLEYMYFDAVVVGVVKNLLLHIQIGSGILWNAYVRNLRTVVIGKRHNINLVCISINVSKAPACQCYAAAAQ